MDTICVPMAITTGEICSQFPLDDTICDPMAIATREICSHFPLFAAPASRSAGLARGVAGVPFWAAGDSGTANALDK